MEIERISRLRFASTILWAIVGSTVVVASAAGLARATLNLNGALVEKPEIAVYLLMPEEHITHVEVLREGEDTKDLLLNDAYVESIPYLWNGLNQKLNGKTHMEEM